MSFFVLIYVNYYFDYKQSFGQVYDVEIPLKNGQSRGYGFVTFEKYKLSFYCFKNSVEYFQAN